MQNRKDVSISIRCTTEEKLELNRLATQSSMSVSNYIIQSCLNAPDILPLNNILPELLTLTNRYQAGVIKKKKFVREVIRRIEQLCPQ